jgi:hypothetical protein
LHKKGTDFAHEKNSGVKEATPLQIANWYADKWAKAYRRQESENKRYSSLRPRDIEEKCKWRLYHNDEMISGSMNKRIKEIVEQHHIKMYFQSKTQATSSCRLGESKKDHWGHIIDTKIHETAIEVWMNKHGNSTVPALPISAPGEGCPAPPLFGRFQGCLRNFLAFEGPIWGFCYEIIIWRA